MRDRMVTVGQIAGPFGVLGWVKVRSHTDPPKNILKYAPWVLKGLDRSEPVEVLEGRPQGREVVARLEGVTNRDEALALKGLMIAVPRAAFPRAREGTYYWADLVGLAVYTPNGLKLGQVRSLMETGANDVLDVRGDRDRLIPFVLGDYVKEVDLDQGRMVVDWDPDF